MIRFLRLLFLIFTLSCLSSCATVFSESSDIIRIDSQPQGADVYFNGEKVGRTPIKQKVVRDTFEINKVTIIKKGHEKQQFRVQKKLNKTALINFTFIPSWLTDALSGNMIRYAPNSYQVFLTPEPVENIAIFDKDERQKMLFILSNYHSLLGDIAQGRGEHLQALWKLSSTKKSTSYNDYLSKLTGHTHELIKTKRGHDLFAKLNEIFDQDN